MRVGVGALAASERAGIRQSGVHQYTLRLTAELPAALAPDELVVYSRPALLGIDSERVKHHRPAVALENPAVRAAWEQSVLPARLIADNVNLYHGLAFVLPRLARLPLVVTIHDLAFIRWPEQTPGRRSAYLSRQVRDAAARARRIIAVSEHTKSEVSELLDIESDRIDVTPLGVDSSFQPMAEAEVDAFRRASNIERPFILAVGNLEPRKNLAALVQAFDRIATAVPHDLVLAGADGWKSAPLHAAISTSRFRDRIRLPGFIEPAQLPAWYAACDLFVIPSLDEGFGLTLLEAMACGAPAIAANRGALPDVGGEAVQLTEPDAESLALTMASTLSDPAALVRLRTAGPLRAAQFTWQRTAQLTAASYRKAMA